MIIITRQVKVEEKISIFIFPSPFPLIPCLVFTSNNSLLVLVKKKMFFLPNIIYLKYIFFNFHSFLDPSLQYVCSAKTQKLLLLLSIVCGEYTALCSYTLFWSPRLRFSFTKCRRNRRRRILVGEIMIWRNAERTTRSRIIIHFYANFICYLFFITTTRSKRLCCT